MMGNPELETSLLMQHPIFDRFHWAPPRTDGAFQVNAIGARARMRFDRGLTPGAPRTCDARCPRAPALDEEYFEWIDMLSAVDGYLSQPSPQKPFVFVELGAGYGRWTVNALCALRQRSPAAPYFAIGVEADSVHFKWMGRNFRDNGIDLSRTKLINAPVSGSGKPVYFHTGDPESWYGQAIVNQDYVRALRCDLAAQRTNNAYVGKPGLLARLGLSRKRYIAEVTSVTMAEILANVSGPIDIVDMDIQGAESEVIESGADLLTSAVRRLHVGTHAVEIEQRLREILTPRSWVLQHDYSCLGLRATPYGDVSFVDGVQSWLNANLT